MRGYRSKLHVVTNARQQNAGPTPTATPSSPPADSIPFKTIMITSGLTALMFAVVNRLFTGAEKRLSNKFTALPPQQNPAEQQVVEQAQAQAPLPRAMSYEQVPIPTVPPPAPTRTASGLTEGDLHLWATELQQREQMLEQRQQLVDKESRRLSLLR